MTAETSNARLEVVAERQAWYEQQIALAEGQWAAAFLDRWECGDDVPSKEHYVALWLAERAAPPPADAEVRARELLAACAGSAHVAEIIRSNPFAGGLIHIEHALRAIVAALSQQPEAQQPAPTSAPVGVDGRIAIEPSERLFQFDSRQEWINHARDILRFHDVRSAVTICVDALGRLVNIGRHFEGTERDWAYPIVVYRLSADMNRNTGAAQQTSVAPVGVELSALRVQEWLHREHDILCPVQEIEQAMRTPCSCPFTERALAQQPAPPSAPVGVDAPGSRAWMAEVCRAAALSLAAHGVRNDQLSKVADWIAQQPAAVDEGFVSRLAEALTDQDWDVDPDGDGSGIAQLRAAVVAAQHQEPKS